MNINKAKKNKFVCATRVGKKKFTRAAGFSFFLGNIFKICNNCLVDLEQVSKVSKTGNNLECFNRFIFSNVT